MKPKIYHNRFTKTFPFCASVKVVRSLVEMKPRVLALGMWVHIQDISAKGVKKWIFRENEAGPSLKLKQLRRWQ